MTIDEKARAVAIEALEPKCRPITGGANPLARRLAEEFVDAALEAYESAKQKEADGWVLVPKEPTLAMCNAGWGEIDTQGFQTEDTEVAPIYRAMLAAAPEPPSALLSAGGEG